MGDFMGTDLLGLASGLIIKVMYRSENEKSNHPPQEGALQRGQWRAVRATGAATFLGKLVILSEAKNLAGITKILRRPSVDGARQNDRFARIPCHIPCDLRLEIVTVNIND
jgi:hypothetical protein